VDRKVSGSNAISAWTALACFISYQWFTLKNREQSGHQSQNTRTIGDTNTKLPPASGNSQIYPKANTARKMIPTEVAEAVDKAMLLHTFAIERGKNVKEDVIRPIIEARIESNRETPDWNSKKEADFWVAYGEICSTLSPITIEAVKAVRPFSKPRVLNNWQKLLHFLSFGLIYSTNSPATVATRWYRIWGVIALMLVLFYQIYWAWGSTLIKEAGKLQTEISVLESALIPLYDAAPQLAMGLENPKEWSRIYNEISLEPPKPPPSGGLSQEQIASARTKYKELANARMMLRSNMEAIKSLDKINVLSLVLGPATRDGDLLYEQHIRLKYVSLTLDAIAVYFLPLLYGLLGACAYILRTVSIEIQDVRYSTETHMRYALRLFLGALTGLAVVWFVKPDAALSVPAAAFFLAGYSVELVFTAMDRLVAAFGAEAGRTTKPLSSAESSAKVATGAGHRSAADETVGAAAARV
jgi:hypothetical protein